jgi:cell division protein FtsX
MNRIAAPVAVLALIAAGCTSNSGNADSAERMSAQTESSCHIEIEFQRSASPAAIATFTRRVERIDRISVVQTLSRQEHIERFAGQLRADGYTGQEFDEPMARATLSAGALLIAKVGEASDPPIPPEFEEMPAFVSSVVESDECFPSP